MSLPHEPLQRANFRFEYLHPSDHFLQLAGIGWQRRTEQDYEHKGSSRTQLARAVLQITLSGEGRIRDRQGVHAVPRHCGMLCVMPGESTYYLDTSVSDHWEFLELGLCPVSDLRKRFGDG